MGLEALSIVRKHFVEKGKKTNRSRKELATFLLEHDRFIYKLVKERAPGEVKSAKAEDKGDSDSDEGGGKEVKPKGPKPVCFLN